MARTKSKFKEKPVGSSLSLEAEEYAKFKDAVAKYNETAPVPASYNDIYRILIRRFILEQLG